jgi:hypothetical protein
MLLDASSTAEPQDDTRTQSTAMHYKTAHTSIHLHTCLLPPETESPSTLFSFVSLFQADDDQGRRTHESMEKILE